MNTIIWIGGPLIVALAFSIWSGLITFGEVEGLEHQAGVEHGGSFSLVHEKKYQCDENGDNCVLVEENTEFSDIEGLEIENEPIEYRNGSEDISKTRQPGIAKYANITIRRPTGFNWKKLKFSFEREVALDEVRKEYDAKLKEMNREEDESKSETGEMYQIDPPVLVIPAN